MKIEKYCIYCGKKIYQVKHSKGICGSCKTKNQWKIRSKTFSEQWYKKRRETFKKKHSQTYETILCKCGNYFEAPKSKHRKYCSEKCQHKYSKPTWNEENKQHLRKAIAESISEGRWRGHNSGIGGFRQDIGHYVRSTFEANYARILIFNKKKYEFEKHFFICNDGSYYIPDFYIPEENKFVEIKGRLSDSKGISKYKEISQREKNYNWKFIGPNEYEELCVKYANKIPNWETKSYNIKSKNWSYT